MELLEKFLEATSTKAESNEDRIFVSGDFLAVIDGATSKSGRLFAGKTGGQAVAEQISRALEEMPPDFTAYSAVQKISKQVYEDFVLPNFGQDLIASDRPSASAVVFSVARSEIWRIGDCHFAIDGAPNYGSKRIDKITANFRAAYNQAELLLGKSLEEVATLDPGRLQILPLLAMQSAFMNNPAAGELAYGVIDGSGDAVGFTQVFSVPRGADVVLCSDGYLEVRATLEESELALRETLAADPLLIGKTAQTKGVGPGNQSYDDRAFVRFRA